MSDGKNPHIDDRRAASNAALIGLVQQVLDGMSALTKSLTDSNADLKNEIKTAITNLKADAFPEGDPDGHRKHHEAVIKAAEEKAEFWKKMRYELVKWGLIGFAGWALVSLWNTFLAGPHK